MTAREQIEAEYQRCLRFIRTPEAAPPLYNRWGTEQVREYYEAKAEGLGFALDRLKREDWG